MPDGDQFHHERHRHPDTLATELIRLRQQNAALRHEHEAIRALAQLVPQPYLFSLYFCHTVAYGQPITSQETPGRQHPASTPPGHNPAALAALNQEQRILTARATTLDSAVQYAAEHPDQPGHPRHHRRIA